MNVTQDFIQTYGAEIYSQVMDGRGKHSESSRQGENEHDQLIFALLEAIDFECPKYGDTPIKTVEEIKTFLLKHKDEVKVAHIEPPSYLGVMAGSMNFLIEEEDEN